jgi:glutamate 5-kinase
MVQILGCKSAEIETILGYTLGDEVIHRNNMVIL